MAGVSNTVQPIRSVTKYCPAGNCTRSSNGKKHIEAAKFFRIRYVRGTREMKYALFRMALVNPEALQSR